MIHSIRRQNKVIRIRNQFPFLAHYLSLVTIAAGECCISHHCICKTLRVCVQSKTNYCLSMPVQSVHNAINVRSSWKNSNTTFLSCISRVHYICRATHVAPLGCWQQQCSATRKSVYLRFFIIISDATTRCRRRCSASFRSYLASYLIPAKLFRGRNQKTDQPPPAIHSLQHVRWSR